MSGMAVDRALVVRTRSSYTLRPRQVFEFPLPLLHESLRERNNLTSVLFAKRLLYRQE